MPKTPAASPETRPARARRRGGETTRPGASNLLVLPLLLLPALGAGRARAADPPSRPPAASAAPAPADPAVAAALATIRAERISPVIGFLASPRLEGREAGERGLEIAADYLVSRLKAAGFAAGSTDGFLQRFRLRRRLLAPDVGFEVTKAAGGGSRTRPLELRAEWIPLAFSEVGTAEGEVVFAGYGVVAPEMGWDDYAPLGRDGARGKVVVVLRHEPDEDGVLGNRFFEGREMSIHASLRQKARVAAARGAIALVVVDDPLHHEPGRPASSLSRWTAITDEQRRLPPDDPKRPRPMPTLPDADAPLGVVAAQASAELLRVLDPSRDWKELQRQMDAAKAPRRVDLPPGITAKLRHGVETSFTDTANVLAVLPGADPVLSKEYVLVGGHYDHEGKDRESGEIYPGADDNGSGTAAVLAMAEAFASMKARPARSLLVAFWSAEEKGLLGSEHFVRHPPVPLEKIVAGLNLDMVGRNKEGEMSVVGRGETPDLVALFDRFAPEVGFALNDDAGAGASRSDNAPLWLAGIPTASLFSGTHEDYHEPSDTADKVVPGKVERAAKLAFLVSRELLDGKGTPKRLDVPTGPWDPVAPPAAPAKGAKEAR